MSPAEALAECVKKHIEGILPTTLESTPQPPPIAGQLHAAVSIAAETSSRQMEHGIGREYVIEVGITQRVVAPVDRWYHEQVAAKGLVTIAQRVDRRLSQNRHVILNQANDMLEAGSFCVSFQLLNDVLRVVQVGAKHFRACPPKAGKPTDSSGVFVVLRYGRAMYLESFISATGAVLIAE